MFGNIIKFEKSKIYVENIKKIADTNYIGFHVVFEEPNHKTVGEITEINKDVIGIQLIGEIVDGIFANGVMKKPGMNTIARIIYKSELELILGNQDLSNRSNLLIGSSPIYKDYIITSNINEFFANHFAVIGNTGSGKSCGLSRLIQNVFFTANNNIPINAHMCLFDVYGEYYNTFDEMDKFVGLHFKKYTTEIRFGDANLLTIPAYLLTVDDLAILLGVKDSSQLPILSKSLELVRIFCSNDPKSVDYKNDIIAKTVLDILSSGKNSTQIRDQVISILTTYHTEAINLDSKIRQPGYERTLRQCLNIDDQGKINALALVINFLQTYVKVDLDIDLDENITYTLSDLYYALEFALISEGILTSESAFDKNNILKSRLQSIINSDRNEFFKFDRYMSRAEFVEDFFKTGPHGENVQLVDINLSFIEDSFAKCLTKIFSRVFFEHTTSLQDRGSFPIHIVLEEAHRYVQNDSDINVLGYNIFDRITKEGRKYGTILGFVTQRPNELSKTALSQCSNFVVFRLFYPEDLEIVKGISSNVTDETLEKIKTLKPGMGLVFGTAFKVPLLVKFPLPNPMPISTSIKIDKVWYQ
ncbi:putative uncharacterized protein [Firmicutes bacterium CAG:582]|nr:putative uncharacterized protein [Firmicutes bacterium CAG:582]